MANLKVNNYHHLRLSINYEDYWDFYVNNDNLGTYDFGGKSLHDDCLISYIDMCDETCLGENGWVYSKEEYKWHAANAVGYTMHDISFTGPDNGLYTFRKDKITNKQFLDLYTGSTFETIANDYRLKLHPVSGSTQQYEYPLSFERCAVRLNGGFLQGFFKTECDKYQVLPSNFNETGEVHFEFELKRDYFEKESDKTLNDKYPDNKGIFFYIGTRAENKWVYLYDDDEGLDKCFELGVDDFVEDSNIDKKNYIIGYFYDMDVDFDGYDPFELGDYTNYNYYGDEEYDLVDDELPVVSEDAPHTTLEFCCGGETEEPITIPFFRGCGCPIVYKKVGTKQTALTNCSAFGEDDYIGDFGDLGDLEEDRRYAEPEINIEDFNYETYEGFELKTSKQYYFYTDNKFLLFDRTKNGYTVETYKEGTQVMYTGRHGGFKGNLFLLMNRAPGGYTVKDIEDLKAKYADNTYNPYADLYDNALAFRIQDDGSIGYRLLTVDCTIEAKNKVKVVEGYSNPNVVPFKEWALVDVRILFVFGKMRMYFYVDGKLVYSTGDLPQLRLRALNELPDKQEGVPYNISLGGGSQGLAETILPNYMLNPWRAYPIEKNFAGSFIGYIRGFRMYECSLEQGYVMNNWRYFKKHIING